MSYGAAFSASYDGLMEDGDYRRRAAALTRQLRRHRPPVKTVLDLGCGTGTISWLLAEQGFQVVAVDRSEEMLTAAMAKAPSFSADPPLFVCQSMPALRLGSPVDAAVSTLDALNYLTRERELRETFRRVFKYLRPGGVFLFDVNTPYKLSSMDGQVNVDETEDAFCVWRTFYSERRSICTWQVDLFLQQVNGAWERSFEEHRERAWSREEITAFLEEAGFTNLRVTGDLTSAPPEERELRWNLRAERATE